MIRVRVTDFSTKQLRRAKELLNVTGTESVLKHVRLGDFEGQVLEFIRSRSARSDKTAARLALSEAKLPLAQQHTADLWRSVREYKGNQVYVRFYNLLETIGGKRGEAKLASIELGSRRTVVTAKRAFRFLGDEHWVSIAQGQEIPRPARRGKRVLVRAQEFIEASLLPKIRSETQSAFRARLSRFR